MSIPVRSNMTILDNLLALNLNISVWSARKKMCLEDFGGAELPPEDLASLGSKRIADPNNLKIFATLKARAFNFLDRHGVRFMSGWAIPEDKAGDIIDELVCIRDEFLKEKDIFLDDYDESIENWINKHCKWGNIIRESTVGSDYVRSRLSFSWQMYKVSPLTEHDNINAVTESGLNDEVEGLANTLFKEIASSANDIWLKIYAGKDTVTHKALSPLRTLHQKLCGLTFVEPHVAPVAQLIQTALKSMPAKGNITGKDILFLQGIVSMLRDPSLMLEHSQKLIEGHSSQDVMNSLLANDVFSICQTSDASPDISLPSMPQRHSANIPNIGLW